MHREETGMVRDGLAAMIEEAEKGRLALNVAANRVWEADWAFFFHGRLPQIVMVSTFPIPPPALQ